MSNVNQRADELLAELNRQFVIDRKVTVQDHHGTRLVSWYSTATESQERVSFRFALLLAEQCPEIIMAIEAFYRRGVADGRVERSREIRELLGAAREE